MTEQEELYSQLLNNINREIYLNQKKDSLTKSFPNKAWKYGRSDQTDINLDSFNEYLPFTATNEKEVEDYFINVYNKSQKISLENKQLIKQLPHEFLQEKINNFLPHQDFAYFSYFEHTLFDTKDNFTHYINSCNYQKLVDNLSTSEFGLILKENISYENKTDIQFPPFSPEENYKIAKLLLPIFSSTSQEPARTKLFYFFKPETRGFIKDFVVENMPLDLFYNYTLLYNDTNPLITEPFSNKEVLTAFHNTEKIGGFFSWTDINAHYDSFFISNFFPRNHSNLEKQSDKDNYLNFLNTVKTQAPKLYVVACHNSILSQVGWDKGKTRDQGIHEFFVNNIDTDTIVEGISTILNDIKSGMGFKTNFALAENTIIRTLHNTYHQNFSLNLLGDTCQSILTEEDTLKYIKLLFNNAPGYLLNASHIGQAIEPIEFFKNYVGEFVHKESIANFLLPDRKLLPLNLSLTEDSVPSQHMNEYIQCMVHYSIREKNTVIVEFMKDVIDDVKAHGIEKASTTSPKIINNIWDSTMALLDKASLKIALEEKLVSQNKKTKIKKI